MGLLVGILRKDRPRAASPDYKLARELSSAHEQEAKAQTAAQREAAIVRYEALMESTSDEQAPEKLAPAALGIAHLLQAGLPRPLPPSEVDTAMKALQRFASIPAPARAGEPTEYVCQQRALPLLSTRAHMLPKCRRYFVALGGELSGSGARALARTMTLAGGAARHASHARRVFKSRIDLRVAAVARVGLCC